MRKLRRLLAAIVTLAVGSVTLANDAASAIAAGGVVLREERRISMRKERLAVRMLGEDEHNIPRFRVVVDYEFLNESGEEVVTEVAFPVPRYEYQYSALEGPVDLGGFKAWVDGAEIPVRKQVRALVGGRDHAATLTALGVDVERHGNFWPHSDAGRGGRVDQLRNLDAAQAARLFELGLLSNSDSEDRWPKWAVEITWHWTQRFPPGKVVRVRHEYTPAAGFRYGFDARELVGEFPRACIDEALVRTLEKQKKGLADDAAHRKAKDHSMIFAAWVDYILTTANTWKTPISEFELVVERPVGRAVSFCWDGKVEKLNATTFSAKAKDFVPKSELTVYFFTVK